MQGSHTWELLLDGRTIGDVKKYLRSNDITYNYLIRHCWRCHAFRIEPLKSSWRPVLYVTGWRMLMPVISRQEPKCVTFLPGVHDWKPCSDRRLVVAARHAAPFITWIAVPLYCARCQTVLLSEGARVPAHKPVYVSNLLKKNIKSSVVREDPGCVLIVKK